MFCSVVVSGEGGPSPSMSLANFAPKRCSIMLVLTACTRVVKLLKAVETSDASCRSGSVGFGEGEFRTLVKLIESNIVFCRDESSHQLCSP